MSTLLYAMLLLVGEKVCFRNSNLQYYSIMGKVYAKLNLPVYAVSGVISCKGNDNKPNTKGK